MNKYFVNWSIKTMFTKHTGTESIYAPTKEKAGEVVTHLVWHNFPEVTLGDIEINQIEKVKSYY